MQLWSAAFTIKSVRHCLAKLLILRLALVFFCAISTVAAQTARPTPTPSLVYAIRDPAAIKDYETDTRVVRAMVNRLVTAATGQPDAPRAWASLVRPTDTVGIKISAAGGELFTTHRDVVDAIVDGLVAAGHRRESIIVWDRSLGGIVEAGYRPQAGSYQIKAVAPGEGYDAKAIFTAPLMGNLVWGDFDYKGSPKAPPLSDEQNTSNASHFARILVNEVTKVINVPVMSISESNAVAGCIYNMTIPNIDNWRRFTQTVGFGAESLAQIYAHPLIAKKVVFNLMDGLLAQYAGGPQSQPNWAMHHATLYASKDPVALDAVALRELQEWRKRTSLPPIGHTADYIQAAAQLGLGNAATNRIELRSVSP
ncbi:MAG TPA: DUF362 domain-containing protein [Chthoniobacterales bacterium]|nr:DUF362 domain-containing protein [Chthoniobacterales bacterium]